MNLANNLTVLRLLLVPLFVGSLLYYSPEKSFLHGASIAVFILACITDGADGYIARKLNQQTVLGSYIDPIADKLLLLSGFFSLSFMSHLPALIRIPAWVTIPVVTRDVIILIGSTMIFLTTGKLKAEPLVIGKITTFCQMITLFISLVAAPREIQAGLFVLTVLFTVISGVQYIRIGERLMR